MAPRWQPTIKCNHVTAERPFQRVAPRCASDVSTLLSKRRHQLVRAGDLDRRVVGNDVQYVLTPAGHELQPVVEAFGVWGVRWIGQLGDEDLDPNLLLRDMRRNIDHGRYPGRADGGPVQILGSAR